MSRLEQQAKIDEIIRLIEIVDEQFQLSSDDLSADEVVYRQERITKLKSAANRLRAGLVNAPPFALDPIPNFNALCEKLRARATQEYMGVIRLVHKHFSHIQDMLLGNEASINQVGIETEAVAKNLADLVQCLKRLGSKKLYEQEHALLVEAMRRCDRAREKALPQIGQLGSELDDFITGVA